MMENLIEFSIIVNTDGRHNQSKKNIKIYNKTKKQTIFSRLFKQPKKGKK